MTFPGMVPPDPYHRARRSDPATSHEAARQVSESRIAESHGQVVLAAVRRWEGRTSAELAENLRLGWKVNWPNVRHEVARRLPELLAAGKVRRGTPRECAATGRRAMTWEPA
jgi:hypothetical protein